MRPSDAMIPFAARAVSPALTRLVRLFGLPEEAVHFVAQASWDDPLRGMSGCHERPVIVELAPPSVVSPQAIWAGASRTWTYHGDVFLFPGRATVAGDRSTSTPGATAAVRMVAETRSEVTFSDDPGWGPLRSTRGRWPTFVQSDSELFPLRDWGPTWDPLLTIDGRPWFLRHRIGPGRTFFWAGPEIPDIAAPITPEDEERGDCLLPLLPLIFFLRRAFGDMLWHTPRHYANLIVDDPPIRDRYGYFAPAQHLGALRGCPHATTIAFIPWNWRRSTASAIELFRQHESELSLCVHGCDHTAGEFSSGAESELAMKSRLALERVRRFHERTGLSCEPVMVFPQGLFSKASMRALAGAQFLAAVNSTLFPVDGGHDVCLADLLAPACTRFQGFPLFLRRYPTSPVLSLVDLFVGRPLLLVEHHGYFRDGHTACRRFLDAINRAPHAPTWLPLHRIVRRACLQRVRADGPLDLRFFSHVFDLDNASDRSVSYRLMHPGSPESVRDVLVDGHPVGHDFDDGHVVFALGLGPRTSARIHVRPQPAAAGEIFSGSLAYRARVWTRRRLCNVRDNQTWLWHGAELVRLGRGDRGAAGHP